MVGKARHQLLQGVVRLGAFVINDIHCQFFVVIADLVQWHDAAHMNDGGCHACFQSLTQKNRIQQMTRHRIESKRNIGQTQHQLNLRQFIVQSAQCLQRVDAMGSVFGIASADGEGERINEEIMRRQAMLFTGEPIKAVRDFDFIIHLFCHAVLVNGESDDAAAKASCQQHSFACRLNAVFKIKGIDHRFAAVELKGLFQNIVFGGINHKRDRDAAAHA